MIGFPSIRMVSKGSLYRNVYILLSLRKKKASLPVVLILNGAGENVIIHQQILVVDIECVEVPVAQLAELLEVWVAVSASLGASHYVWNLRIVKPMSKVGHVSLANTFMCHSTWSFPSILVCLLLNEVLKAHANLLGSLVLGLGNLACWLKGCVLGSTLALGSGSVGQGGGIHAASQVGF